LFKAFIPANIIVYLVKEREFNVKHQQMVSGVSIAAYWASNYIVDLAKYIIPGIFCGAMIKAYNLEAFLDDNGYPATWALCLMLGVALMPFTYLLSFLFKDYGNAQTVTFFICYLSGGGLFVLVVLILRIIDSTIQIGKGLSYLFRLFPPFCFGYGLISIPR